ncbi:MAG: A/G-specific adenine glycosylase [Tannerellaceae bacterium]|jgi:A/G-specific adenine glycosylase|nr:A/G-specific adenine glycosylase [Tannerellaceae bacterium]
MEISDRLVDWYGTHKRDLPWRNSADPYIIWISEIILQQTRVAQGMSYFLHFTKRFPDVQSLANAHEDDVLKYWQGLGYYSRARNLHAAARQIIELYDGRFPTEYKEVLSLKGVGEYTASAIVSFVWNQPYPVVDGNVFRVLSRLFALGTPIDTSKGKKEYTELAASVMNPEKAGLHNQAIMEFGALQCVPQNPDCGVCPLQDKCAGFATGTPQSFPVKQNKTKTRNRYFHYLHILYEGKTWLNRRSGNDIWKGLYELPLIETEMPADFTRLQQTTAFRRLFGDAGKLSISIELSGIKHVLSHQILYASFYKIEIGNKAPALDSYLEIPDNNIGNYAVPRLVQLYLAEMLR